MNASILFSLKFKQKKQPQKPKPRSYFKSNTPVCAILSDRTGQEIQDPDPTWWEKSIFNTFPIECWKKTTTKTKILPKAEKIIFQYLSNLNLTRKKQPPNQDLAKSWKNPVFNTFQIKKWTEKNSHQNQDLAKSWKRHFSILFLIKNWREQSNHQSCQKLKQTFFQYFSNQKIEEKKQPQKPKPRFTLNPTLRCVPSYLTAPDKKCRILNPLDEKNQFFNTFPIKIRIKKTNHQNQDLAKSWTSQFFNTFRIKIWTEKTTTKTKI